MTLSWPKIQLPDTRGWLALGGFGQVTTALWLLAYIPIPKENHDLFVVLISQVIGVGFIQIVGFFFGSSKGASDNRDQLNKTMDTLAAQGDGKSASGGGG